MRNVINPQLQLGQIDIGQIEIDITSRDDIPVILLGLQHIDTNDPLREAVFNILTDVIPCKVINDNVIWRRLMPVKDDQGWISGQCWC